MRRLPFVSEVVAECRGTFRRDAKLSGIVRPPPLVSGEVGRRAALRFVPEVQRRPVLMVALLGTDPNVGSRPLLIVLAGSAAIVTRHDSENGVKVHTVSDQF